MHMYTTDLHRRTKLYYLVRNPMEETCDTLGQIYRYILSQLKRKNALSLTLIDDSFKISTRV